MNSLKFSAGLGGGGESLSKLALPRGLAHKACRGLPAMLEAVLQLLLTIFVIAAAYLNLGDCCGVIRAGINKLLAALPSLTALTAQAANSAEPASSSSSVTTPVKTSRVSAAAASLEGKLDLSKMTPRTPLPSASLAATSSASSAPKRERPSPPVGEVDRSVVRSVKDLRKDKIFIGKLKRVLLAGGPFARPKAEERADAISVSPPSTHYMAELKDDQGNFYTLASPSNAAGQFVMTDPNWQPNPPPSGTYAMTVKLKSQPPLALQPEGRPVTIQQGQVREPSRIKLQATSLRVVFSDKDMSAPVNTPVTGTFSPRVGRQVTLDGFTDANGSEDFPLPAGQVQNLQARLASGVVISRKEPIEVPLATRLREALRANGVDTSGADDWDDEDEEDEAPLLFNIAQNATSCANVVSWMSEAETRAVILGDISGSMGAYRSPQMEALRKSFREQAEAIQKKSGKIALVAWCSWLQWCPVSEWNVHAGASWQSAVDASTISWISNLAAGGGNDMRFAIEQVMAVYDNATDVWVMCDGDISPFVLQGGLVDCCENVRQPAHKDAESSSSAYNRTNWKAFCSRWPNVRFHFIAFHHHADRTGMPMMAQEGGGSFSQYTFMG